MAKRGGSKHQKRIAVPKAILLPTKKESTWLVRTMAGGHSLHASMPLAVLLRDVLHYAKTMSEVKKILSQRFVLVDGQVRVEPKFPVGFMDVIELPKAGKHYIILVDNHSRLIPKEISKDQKSSKLVKVVKKYTIPGNKIAVTLHDGKTMQADNNVKVGDSIRISLPKLSIQQVVKLAPGAKCIIREGKHAGMLAVLDEIIQRKEGRAAEAKLKHGKEEFVTVAKYLFVVDEGFKI